MIRRTTRRFYIVCILDFVHCTFHVVLCTWWNYVQPPPIFVILVNSWVYLGGMLRSRKLQLLRTTLRMSEGDDPVKFLELFSTLLLKAQIANFKLSEEDKATYFLRALPVTFESLKSEWKSLQRIKEITKLPTSTFEDLRGMFVVISA